MSSFGKDSVIPDKIRIVKKKKTNYVARISRAYRRKWKAASHIWDLKERGDREGEGNGITISS